MAKQIASGETGTTAKEKVGGFNTLLIFLEFVTPGDVDIEATPDGGTTWLKYGNIDESGISTLSKSPEELRLVANNGAEFNAWVE